VVKNFYNIKGLFQKIPAMESIPSIFQTNKIKYSLPKINPAFTITFLRERFFYVLVPEFEILPVHACEKIEKKNYVITSPIKL